MLTRRRHLLIQIYKIFDLLTMACCFLFAGWFTSYFDGTVSFRQVLSMRIKVQNLLALTGFLILWNFVLNRFRIYHSKRLSSLWIEIVDLVTALTVGSMAIFVLSKLLRIRLVDGTFLLVFWGSVVTVSLLSRVILRYLLKRSRIHGRNLRDVLIVGTNSRAIQFARAMESRMELGYRVIGFADDPWKDMEAFHKTGHKQVSTIGGIPTFLGENVVDEVVLCLPLKSFYQREIQIISACREQGILVRLLSDFFDFQQSDIIPERFEGRPLISIYPGVNSTWGRVVKRVVDFGLSLCLIVMLSPLFLATALLIKATSPGPVLFSQLRLGRNKRGFRLYKFRTMVRDAEKRQVELESMNDASGPVFKIRNDPRITSVGRVLRKTSIDELPQLFNVLKGDMSLVGPRPLPVRDYKGFDQDWHRRRFSVFPGITCLWQVSGRSNLSFDKWMELDMEYIDRWTLLLDFKILAKTVPAVFRREGAA
jgi:exopolysaccharide biosynthesis polyprenyl glycosylphosphotransferase